MAEAPFIGRVDELEALRRELAETSGSSRMVLVMGDAGVGKTRLLAEFRRRLGATPCLVGRGSPVGSVLPFSVLVEALQAHLRTLSSADIATLCGDGLADLATILPGAAGAFGSAPAAPSSRLGLLEAFAGLISALAGDRPLVLELDDAHQADPSTWEALNYLGRNPIPARVLFLAAFRSEALADDDELRSMTEVLVKDGLARQLRLSAFSREDVVDLVSRSVDASREDPGFSDWLFDRTRGNALFTVALLEDLAADPSRRVVPVSVRERVRSAVTSLTPGEADTLEKAAVLGHSFELATIATLIGADRALSLDGLVRKGLLVERSEGILASYDFAHPLVQEAIYEGLGAARRRELHDLAATTLTDADVSVRAYHAARGALPGDADAIDTILLAARERERQQSHREALSHLTAALELIPGSRNEERKQVLDEIAWQANEVGDHAVGIPALRELGSLVASDPCAFGAVKMRLSSFLASGEGDLPGAEAEIVDALRLFEDCHGQAQGADATSETTEVHVSPGRTFRLGIVEAVALNELAWVRGQAGDLAAQAAMSGEVIELAIASGGRIAELHALGAHGHALALLGRTGEAIEDGRRGVELANETGERAQIGWHTGVLADAFALGGRFAEAAATIDPLLDAGPCPSDVAYFSRARLNWFLGRWKLALDDCRAIQAMNPTAPPIHSAWTPSVAGLILVASGRAGEAGPWFAQSERIFADRDFYAFSCFHQWATGYAAWLLGDGGHGRSMLERAAAWAARMDARPVEAQILPDLVEVLVETGDIGAAEERAEHARVLASGLGSSFADATAAYATGLVASGRRDRASSADAFDSAALSAGSCSVPFLRARALERLSGMRDGGAALEPLTEAARIYASLPAPAFERRALEKLRDLGSTGRRAAQSVGALTGREREVAALARSGLTTREIAARLHLSERTIESHLAHVYGKLQIEGRHELDRWDSASDAPA